ncbi:MAG: hypothetical protein HY960_07335 [Ignavibacteriae bacterium]|nr:hypothetical protein [Ignavibacteriota bacterium]
MKDNYAFIGNGPTFHALDVSNPTTPTIIGEYLTDGIIIDLKIKNNIAYLCIGNNLLLVDISIPSNPSKLSEIYINGFTTNVAFGDSLVYVATWGGTLFVVDASEPSSPQIKKTIGASSNLFWCIAAKGDYVYVSDLEWWGTRAINVVHPESVFVTFGYDLGLSAYVIDTLLFIGGYGYINTYSISNPSAPVLVNTLDSPSGAITGMTSKDSIVYAVTDAGSVYAIDITTPDSLVVRGSLQGGKIFGTAPLDIAVGNELYVTRSNGLQIVDILLPDSLEQLSFFPTSGDAEKVTVSGNKAYLACGYAGLWIIDISDVLRPVALGNINTGGFMTDVLVSGNYAYTVNYPFYENDTTDGVWIIDIQNPQMPNIVSHYIGINRYSGNSGPNSLAISGTTLFMTQVATTQNDYSTLELININQPTHPLRAGVYDNNNSAITYHVSVLDSFAYLAIGNRGLKIIDWHSSSNLQEIGTVLNFAIGVGSKDSLMFAFSPPVFTVFNVSNPFSPDTLGIVTIANAPSTELDVALSGNFVYWAETYLGAIDISDVRNPVQTAFYSPPYFDGYVRSVDVTGDTIFTANFYNGMSILRRDSTTTNVQLVATGWNLLSLSLEIFDPRKNTLYPTATSNAFIYNDTYIQTDTLPYGTGYWIKFGENQSITMRGKLRLSDTIAVNKGWNIIGGLSETISVNSISSVPDSIIASGFYKYEGSYVSSDSIESGKGYWVKCASDGVIIFISQKNKKKN